MVTTENACRDLDRIAVELAAAACKRHSCRNPRLPTALDALVRDQVVSLVRSL